MSDVLSSLGINGTLFAAQLVNFAIVLLIAWRWIYKPLVKMMDDRAKKISDGLANAEEAKRQLASADVKKEKMVRAAHQEAQTILQTAKVDAERERQEIKKQTQQELDRQLADARDRLKQEKEATIKAVKNEMADLIVAASAKVGALGLDAGDHRKHVTQAVKELEHV